MKLAVLASVLALSMSSAMADEAPQLPLQYVYPNIPVEAAFVAWQTAVRTGDFEAYSAISNEQLNNLGLAADQHETVLRQTLPLHRVSLPSGALMVTEPTVDVNGFTTFSVVGCRADKPVFATVSASEVQHDWSLVVSPWRLWLTQAVTCPIPPAARPILAP